MTTALIDETTSSDERLRFLFGAESAFATAVGVVADGSDDADDVVVVVVVSDIGAVSSSALPDDPSDSH
jgi:hypothetical protein